MRPEEVMAEIEPSLPFIRGVTVSGGECTLYPAFLRALGALVKERSLTFFLDSNGSYEYARDAALMALTDAVMLDVKADPQPFGTADNSDAGTEFRRVTGKSGGGLLDKMDFLAGTGKLWEVRTVVSPGLFDAASLVEKVCRRLAQSAAGHTEAARPRYKLIRYRPSGVRPTAAEVLATPTDAQMNALAALCARQGIEAVIL
jgi:pyruvate formate lyase activating enzyme